MAFALISTMALIALPFIILGLIVSVVQYIFLLVMLKYVYKIEKHSPWTIFGIVIFSGIFSSSLGIWSFPVYFLVVAYALSRYSIPKLKAFLTAAIFVILTIFVNFVSLKIFLNSSGGASKKVTAINAQYREPTKVEFFSKQDGFKVLFTTSSPQVSSNPDMSPQTRIKYERRFYQAAGSLISTQQIEVIDDNGQYNDLVVASDPERTWKILQMVSGWDSDKNSKFERVNFLDLQAIRYSNKNSSEKGMVFQKNNKFFILSADYTTDEDLNSFINSFQFADAPSTTSSTADVDTDGDGLTDQQEITIYKTNPNKADTDGDGFSDGAEVKNGFNPNGPGKLVK